MKKALMVFGVLIGLLFVVAGIVLVPPHLQIRHVEPSLPSLADVEKLTSAEHGPIRISAIDTALQPIKNRMSGNAVFIIEWEDGRMFMVDAGMDKAGATDFAKTAELLGATGPLDYRSSVAQVLGDRIKNIQGVGFTHLHIDHVQGVQEFCERRGRGAKVYQSVTQATIHILHTKEGAQIVRDSCLQPVVVEGEGIIQLRDFPGLAMLPVGGHTPGSTIFFVTVGNKLWVLSGDVANFKPDLLNNQGKGFLYSYLIVPENTQQLEKLRVWLAALDVMDSVEVIVSHDADALAKSEILKL